MVNKTMNIIYKQRLKWYQIKNCQRTSTVWRHGIGKIFRSELEMDPVFLILGLASRYAAGKSKRLYCILTYLQGRAFYCSRLMKNQQLKAGAQIDLVSEYRTAILHSEQFYEIGEPNANHKEPGVSTIKLQFPINVLIAHYHCNLWCYKKELILCFSIGLFSGLY